MKTLKITLVAAIFCLTLTGLNNTNDLDKKTNKENVTESNEFTYSFATQSHVKKGEIGVPSNG